MRTASGNPPSRHPAVLVSLLLLALTPGCNLIEAPFAAAKSRKNPARFVLPDRPVVIVVEGTDADAQTERFTRQVAATSAIQLTDNAALPTATVVEPAALIALQEELGIPQFEALAIDEIGRRMDAETVVYVQVVHMTLNARDSFYRPEAQMQVRVVDALTGKRLFPQPDAPSVGGKSPAHSVVVGQSFETIDTATAGRTAEDRTRRALAQEAGLAVARLFYEWSDTAPGAGAEAEKRRLEAARRRDRAQ